MLIQLTKNKPILSVIYKLLIFKKIRSLSLIGSNELWQPYC